MYEVEILTLHTGKRVWYKNLGGRESKSDDKNVILLKMVMTEIKRLCSKDKISTIHVIFHHPLTSVGDVSVSTQTVIGFQ